MSLRTGIERIATVIRGAGWLAAVGSIAIGIGGGGGAVAARTDGATQVAVSTSGSHQNPAWSPDGLNLLFTRWVNGYNAEPADLLIVTLAGLSVRTLVSNGSANVNLPGSGATSTWNGTTNKIVFTSSRAPHDEAWTIGENGPNGSETQITSRPDKAVFEASLSPDGQTIVFESHGIDVVDNGVIFTYKVDGSGPYTALTDTATDSRQPVWSPAGNKIVFQRQAGGQWDIWTMNPDGSGQSNVTNSATFDETDPSFSPDGSRIVYSSNETGGAGIANIFVVPAAGGASTRVTRFSGYDGAPSWSPDGAKIAFESSSGDPDGSAGTTLWVIAAPAPPPPGSGASAKTLGSRATVSTTATLYGGFELVNSALVYILVRGNSLGTLGVTQGFLDAPRVRIYNSQGQDMVSDQGGRAGFNGCSTSSTSATPVVNYYQNVRGQPAHDRDGCIAQTLAPGPYTFSVTPSTPGVTTDSAVSTPNVGEVLFEVTLGGGGGSITKTLGSRATVAQAATLYGGFEIASSSVVYILVRGNSLGTLGVTQSYLDAPRVRLFDSQGRDLITDVNGDAGFNFCLASNSSQKPVFDFYSLIRHQAAEGRDACVAQTLAPGVYTFSVTPTASSIPSTGEVLFEVTLSP